MTARRLTVSAALIFAGVFLWAGLAKALDVPMLVDILAELAIGYDAYVVTRSL